jgi:alpha-mannosidase
MLFFTEEKIEKLLQDIRPTIWRESYDIPVFRFIEADIPEALSPDFDDSDWSDFTIGSFWGGYDKIAWFRAHVPIPQHLRGKKLALRFLVGPRDGGDSTAETLLYVNGKALQGIDIWHEEAWLPPEEIIDDCVVIALRSWSGVLGVPDRRRFKVAQLNWIDEVTESLYRHLDILLKAVQEMDEHDWRRGKLLDSLNNAVLRINFIKLRSEEYYCSIAEALSCLEAELAKFSKLEVDKPKLVPIGHAHIDMAWLWRLSHSREKAGRSFSTVLHYMRQYPEYHFMHSSPQLYKYLAQDFPELFERVKEKIASGQWEITGGMWIEPDTNLVSGESLIRQILYGKRYIRETFGQESYTLWLPDVFGYSWALPQILKKSGMKYFMTSKLSWNQFNRFPYDTFHWRGIDGTEILTQLITTPEEGSKAFTYNGTLSPHEIKGAWENYNNKALNDELLVTFGWGDGGGGPTKEMIEGARIMRNLPGFPEVELGKVEPYFERLEQRVQDKKLPVWDGELYLEFHRGTYTSQAETKRNNRKSEILFHDAEWLSTLAEILTGSDSYPDLREAWELILLNQFHDILPGSSIRQVYEDSAVDFARVKEIGEAALAAAEKQISKNIYTEQDSVVVFN